LSQKNKDSLEASHRVQEIHQRILKLREQVNKRCLRRKSLASCFELLPNEFSLLQVKQLPGVERNEEEQLQLLEILKRQLQMKKQLVAKYKDINLKVNGLSSAASSFQQQQ